MNVRISVARAPFLAALLGALVAAASFAEEDDDFDRTPRECINISRIDHTRIIDEHTILFYMRGNEIYRNYMPEACRGLSPRDPFLYSTTSRELCDVDAIELLESWGSQLTRGRSCELGLFYPITEEEVEELEHWPSPGQIEANEPSGEAGQEEEAQQSPAR